MRMCVAVWYGTEAIRMENIRSVPYHGSCGTEERRNIKGGEPELAVWYGTEAQQYRKTDSVPRF